MFFSKQMYGFYGRIALLNVFFKAFVGDLFYFLCLSLYINIHEGAFKIFSVAYTAQTEQIIAQIIILAGIKLVRNWTIVIAFVYTAIKGKSESNTKRTL